MLRASIAGIGVPLVIALGLTGASGASAATVASGNEAITLGDTTHVDRPDLTDPADTCASNNGVTSAASAGSHHYDSFGFTNFTNDPVCITVTIDPQTCMGATGLGSAAYAPSFNPAAVTTNALADIGASPAAMKSYSFNAPPGDFFVNVNEVNEAGLCSQYVITIDSLQPFATAGPAISGIVTVGSTLNGQSTWAGAPTLTHQWRRCNAAGGACSDIAGATAGGYTPVAADRGMTIRDRVTATEAGQTSIADSPPTVAVGVPFSTATGAIGAGDPTQSPRLFRDATPDTCAATKTLTTTEAGNFRYDLYTVDNITNGPLCVSVGLDGTACLSAIFSGAYIPSFDPASIVTNGVADGGSSPGAVPIRSYSYTAPPGVSTVNVHEVNAGAGCSSYGITLASVEPFATAAPAISGNAIVNGTLTGAPGTWTGNPSFGHQWRRCDGAGNSCADIAGATAATYTPTAADLGSTLRDRVTATEAGAASTVDSPATGAVGPAVVIPDTDPPETTITKEPKNKLKTAGKRKKARYEFESDEPGSFMCKVDKKAVKPCDSPLTLKAKLGKHTFQVFAIDPAGNADQTPDTDRFKVKPK